VDDDGHHYRIFIGDVNDFTNIECLYMMDSVVTVGKFVHIDNVVTIYNNPERTDTDKKVVTKVKNPFAKSQMKPSSAKKQTLNKMSSKKN